MVTLPMILGVSSPPNNPNFCILRCLVMGEHRDVKFGMQVDHSKSQSTDDKMSLKGARSRHVTHFKLSVTLKYFWDRLSYRLQIL